MKSGTGAILRAENGGTGRRLVLLVTSLVTCAMAAFSGRAAADNVSTPLFTYPNDYGRVRDVTFSPDGTKILMVPEASGADVLDAATGTKFYTVDDTVIVTSGVFSPDGTQVLTGSSVGARLWNAADGGRIRTFSASADHRVDAVAFSPDGTKILTGSSDKTAKLWSVSTGTLIRTFTGHSDYLLSVAFSPDGTKILTGSSDKTAKIWNANTGALVRTIDHAYACMDAVFSPDGSKVLTIPLEKAILWDAATGVEIRSFSGYASGVDVTFSPTGTHILTAHIYGGPQRAVLWDTATGAEIRSFLPGNNNSVNAVAFSPDESKVLTGDGFIDVLGHAKLWESGLVTEVSVPNVAGESLSAAQAAIVAAGLSVGTVAESYSATVPVGNVISQNPTEGAKVAPGTPVNLTISKGPAPTGDRDVPNVVGMSRAQAEAAIAGAGLSVGTVIESYSSTVAVGIVLSQNPAAGTEVGSGTPVNLTISKGPAPAGDRDVPNVVGMSRAQAEAAIAGAGLSVGAVSESYSATVPTGTVISQNPAAGVMVASGTPVNLEISKGTDPDGGEGEGEPSSLVVSPDVVGWPVEAAKQIIAAAGLSVGAVAETFSVTVPAGDVISQNPSAGIRVASGTAVALNVSKGQEPDTGCGCGCDKSGLTLIGLKKRLGDMFLVGLALAVLAGMGSAASTAKR